MSMNLTISSNLLGSFGCRFAIVHAIGLLVFGMLAPAAVIPSNFDVADAGPRYGEPQSVYFEIKHRQQNFGSCVLSIFFTFICLSYPTCIKILKYRKIMQQLLIQLKSKQFWTLGILADEKR